MPALKKWISLRFGALDGEDGSELSVQRIVASLNSSKRVLVGVGRGGRNIPSGITFVSIFAEYCRWT